MDATSHYKVVGVPFKGGKLFGVALDLLLVWTKGKKKVFSTQEKPSHVQNPKVNQLFLSSLQVPPRL